jgi:hypothetical protein
MADTKKTNSDKEQSPNTYWHTAFRAFLKIGQPYPGIYRIGGDFVPIQIIETKGLAETENLWLNNLRDNIEPDEAHFLVEVFKERLKDSAARAYFSAIMNGNTRIFEEVYMEVSSELQKVMDEVGFTAKWKAFERDKVRDEIAHKALAAGIPEDVLKQITGLDKAGLRKLDLEIAPIGSE